MAGIEESPAADDAAGRDGSSSTGRPPGHRVLKALAARGPARAPEAWCGEEAESYEPAQPDTRPPTLAVETQGPSLVGRLGRLTIRSAAVAARLFSSKCSECEQAIEEDPEVAVVVRAEEEVQMPDAVQVSAEFSLAFFDSPRRLLVCKLRRPTAKPAMQLMQLQVLIEAATSQAAADDGPFLWPLHSEKVRQALLALEEIMVSGGVRHMRSMAIWKRVLYWLRIYLPQNGGPFFSVIRDVYGPSVGFNFAWAHFYTQQVWLLAALVVLCLCLGVGPAESGGRRVLWELSKFGVLVWGGAVVLQRRQLLERVVPHSPPSARSPRRSQHSPTGGQAAGLTVSPRRPRTPDLSFCESTKPNPEFQELGRWEACRRWAKLLLLVVPLLSAFIMAINLTLLGVAQLIVHLIYVWGDCMHRGCRDPADKHHFWGWLAEVAVDVLLAILFELFFALTKLLAEWLASIRNHKTEDDRRLSVELLTVVIAGVERVGTFGIVAFVFVPQWEEPSHVNQVDMSRDCSDLIIGDASFFCLQRRLPLKRRQEVFARSLLGPFVVAPWVAIIIKVLVPIVAARLDQFARAARCMRCCSVPCSLLQGVARILALIFAYDGDSVGCLRFVFFGWPFRELAGPHAITTATLTPCSASSCSPKGALGSDAGSPSAGAKGITHRSLAKVAPEELEPEKAAELEQEREALERILRQGARKPFEPMNEMLEMELNFLWVIFFAPILPWGIIPMLFARIFETKSDLTKLLFTRRRSFPEPDGLERSLQRAFMRAAVCSALGWSAGLSLITYNPELWRWGWWKLVLPLAVILWLVCSAGVALMHADAGWCGVVVGVATFVLVAVSCLLLYDEVL